MHCSICLKPLQHPYECSCQKNQAINQEKLATGSVVGGGATCRGCGQSVNGPHQCPGPFSQVPPRPPKLASDPCAQTGCRLGKWEILDTNRQARRCTECGRVCNVAAIPAIKPEATL
jgi:hypothetical protein